MKKQMNNKIFKAMLSILVLAVTVAALCMTMLFATAGAETGKKSLTLLAQGEAAEKISDYVVTYVPEGSSVPVTAVPVEKNATPLVYSIPVGSAVTVKVVSIHGWIQTLDDTTDIVELGNTTGIRNYNWTEGTQTIRFTPFYYDSTVTLTSCQKRTYSIKAVDYNAVDEKNISYVQSTWDNEMWQTLKGGQLTYTYEGEQ
ncbi:MAG: hypothetical protein IJX80_04020, partial [Clostridia bacterium]|nr:hypothetical protein [Clostridia bacterium]